jgi:3-hydroxyisobutyrate dehydrogenase-like beta-hydroxyacid dehydrogenase
MSRTIGFVGLGNIGAALAANLVDVGHDLVTHDLAGPERSPDGARFAADVTDIADEAEVVVLSLPDGSASRAVAEELVGRRTTHVVDTSTVGVEAAPAVDGLLAAAGIAYVDAPVSGGVAGARARTLSVMYAGPDDACAEVAAVLAGLSDRSRRVGERPGMAQALKLANNFLSATALAATSEAVAFGRAVGLDPATMVEVLDASSGRNTATSEKFPNHVLTRTYDSGFANTLMAKDLALYLQAVEEEASPSVLAPVTAAVWERFAAAEPAADFTRIYPFVAEGPS